MTPQAQLDDIKNCANKLSVKLIFRDLSDIEFSFHSGYCKVKGSQIIILDKKLPIDEQINIILRGFERLDLDSFFISPWIRDRLEKLQLKT